MLSLPLNWNGLIDVCLYHLRSGIAASCHEARLDPVEARSQDSVLNGSPELQETTERVEDRRWGQSRTRNRCYRVMSWVSETL
jgi:hypothetical protein